MPGQDPVESAALDAIVNMSDERANSFLGALLHAQLLAHGLHIENFAYASDANESDSGVDAHLDMASVDDPPFPPGSSVWQLKSGDRAPTVSADLDHPSKQYLRQCIVDGDDLVLVWTRARPARVQRRIRETFGARVAAIRPGARFTALFAEQMAALAMRHPGLLVDHGLTPFVGMSGLEAWRQELPGSDISYVRDARRDEILSRLEGWSRGDADPLHLFGGSGVGKSRTALEALTSGQAEGRLFYAASPGAIPQGFWPWMLRHEQSSCLLVVDECSIDEVPRLHALAGASSGRVRLLTIGHRGDDRGMVGGGQVLEMPPLDVESLGQGLQEKVGLTTEQATFIARHTKGYPRLAFEAARAVKANPAINVSELSRTGFVLLALRRMLPAEGRRRLLGVLALFTQIGVDGPVAEEAVEVCEVFGLRVTEFLAAVNGERDVVGRAGPYRKVTPDLFAVWVGTERMGTYGASLADRVLRLPPHLYERFRQQLATFGPASEAKDVVARLLEDEARPFDLGRLDRSARLLRAAVAVDRRRVADILGRVLAKERPALDSISSSQEIVWTLQHLLWYPDTFALALRLLFWMALTEPRGPDAQPITAPATSALGTAFLLHLGATSIPYTTRLQVLQEIVEEEATDQAWDLAGSLVLNALSVHEFRTAPAVKGGEVLPQEWRPSTAEEEYTGRRTAWEFAIRAAGSLQDPQRRRTAAERVAAAVGWALRLLPGQDVIPSLEQVALTPAARAKAAHEIRLVIEYESMTDDYRALLRDLVAGLKGTTLEERTRFVISSSPWELAESREEHLTTPADILQVATDLADHPEFLGRLLSLARNGDSLTVGQLFEQIAYRVEDVDGWYSRILSDDPVVWVAVVGFLVARDRSGDEQWVNERLRELADSAGLRDLLPAAIFAVSATDQRGDLAIRLIQRRHLPGREFTRLMYGRWVTGLSTPIALSLIGLIADDDSDIAYEAAVAMLEDVVSMEEAPSAQVSRFAAELLTRRASGSQMVALHQSKILDRVELDFETRLSMLIGRLEATDAHLLDQDLALFDQLVEDDAAATVRAIGDHILAQLRNRRWSRWGLGARRFAYLSRAVRRVGHDAVLPAIRGLSEREWASLMRYIDFSNVAPDPLLRWMIENSSSDDVLRAASSGFLGTPSFWRGSQIPVLEERRRDARAWAATGTPRFRAWAGSLQPFLDRAIQRAGLLEAEFE
jgi:hypothetical protein